VNGANDETIRVLVVDDHEIVARAMARALGDEPGIEVVGVARSVREVRAFTGEVDVVLMDYALPDGTGADATRVVKQRLAHARVVMVTGLTDDEPVLDAIHAGADGYVLKSQPFEDMVEAVRLAHQGRLLIPPAIVARIARMVASNAAGLPGATPRPELTPRECDVLTELAAGRAPDEICRRLGIEHGTLRTHVDHIVTKLGTHSRAEAVAAALADPRLRAIVLRGRADFGSPPPSDPHASS
jgi:two-component system, NarL family, nitrate/nitrite response regulator NarL